jgi:hypothetical protein
MMVAEHDIGHRAHAQLAQWVQDQGPVADHPGSITSPLVAVPDEPDGAGHPGLPQPA